jgi:hypothetical protein
MKEKLARIYGGVAFESEKPGIPALDENLTELLEGLKVGEGTPIYKAWIKGWAEASLAAE